MAATRGLHATGMREVAAQAGVSLRLAQYYFGTKEELLLAAMQRLAAQFSPVDLDPDLEAVSLLTMSAGLGTSVIVGQSSVTQAQAVVDYHLYRLFPMKAPAAGTAAPSSSTSP